MTDQNPLDRWPPLSHVFPPEPPALRSPASPRTYSPPTPTSPPTPSPQPAEPRTPTPAAVPTVEEPQFDREPPPLAEYRSAPRDLVVWASIALVVAAFVFLTAWVASLITGQ